MTRYSEFSFDASTDTGITQATVTDGTNSVTPQQVAVPVRDPAVGLTGGVAVKGVYRTRPSLNTAEPFLDGHFPWAHRPRL